MAVEPIKIYAGDRKVQKVAFTLRFCKQKGIPHEYININDSEEVTKWILEERPEEAPYVVLPNGKKFSGFRPELIEAWIDESQPKIVNQE